MAESSGSNQTVIGSRSHQQFRVRGGEWLGVGILCAFGTCTLFYITFIILTRNWWLWVLWQSPHCWRSQPYLTPVISCPSLPCHLSACSIERIVDWVVSRARQPAHQSYLPSLHMCSHFLISPFPHSHSSFYASRKNFSLYFSCPALTLFLGILTPPVFDHLQYAKVEVVSCPDPHLLQGEGYWFWMNVDYIYTYIT